MTYRLAGSLPREALAKLQKERERLSARPPRLGGNERASAVHKEKILFAMMDNLLAAQIPRGESERSASVSCWLGDSQIAGLVRESLLRWAGHRYQLHRWVIMPNHVHILIEPLPRQPTRAKIAELDQESQSIPLRKILQSLKGYTAREANRILGCKGAFWQRESYDHWIRDEREYRRVVQYIDLNPVKAGLCAAPEEWAWSSAGEQKNATHSTASPAAEQNK